MDKQYDIVWKECLRVIRDNVPETSFSTWFSPIVPIRLENNILTIQVPSPFFYEYLEEHYIDILRKTLRRVLGQDAKLGYSVIMHRQKGDDNTVQLPPREAEQLHNRPLNATNEVIRNPFVIPGIKKLHVDPQLNPANSFENYIEGRCNHLARQAGLAVAQNPGNNPYNPLLLY
ncbi:MAG: chromosomal replication initiator protein DnaA, partial [Bacteroidota bacterium]